MRHIAKYGFILLLTIVIAFNLKAQTASSVRIVQNSTTGLTEIRNGLLGVVLPPLGITKPTGDALAPIQGIIYADGTYSTQRPSNLTIWGKVSSLNVQVLNKSDESFTVQCLYKVDAKKFSARKITKDATPAGSGYFSCTITVEKGKKTIVVEEESDCELNYIVRLTNGLQATQARYRGWGSYSMADGREPDGKIYRSEDERGFPMDATVDLDYSKQKLFQRLVLWEPAGGEYNSGRYWQVYNDKADKKANLLGFFQGRSSRLIMGGGMGPSLFLWPEDPTFKDKNVVGLYVNITQDWPTDRWAKRKRYEWVLFVSTKQDLLPPDKIQPIAVEMNRYSGLGNVIKKYATDPVTIVPSFYNGGIYMAANKMALFRNNIASDQAFYTQTVATESLYKPIWDAWRFPDSAKSLLKQLLSLEDMFVQQYTVKDGTYARDFRYWKGARMFKLYALSASCLLVEPSITISAADKKKLEQLIGLMARIVWDDNNVPMRDSAGMNMGPANMEFQYRNNARVFFALLLANDPEFQNRAKQIVASTNRDINAIIYSNGSTFGSPHYMQPAIDPILFTVLQLKQARLIEDDQWDEQLKKFAGFCTSLLTPPSVRFAGNRKFVNFGDGSEESSATLGLLAAVLRYSNKSLSDQLMVAFHKGAARSSFAGPVMLAVDTKTVPTPVPINLGPSNYPGYLSHFRSAPNTEQESALWFINGDEYYDHRNDDAGEVAIYALGAPLSLSRSSFYYPSANDGRIRSVVVPEKLFPEWNRGEQPIIGRSLTNRTWPKSSLSEFANLGRVTYSSAIMQAEGKTWKRSISMIMLDDKTPAYIFYDSVSGNENNIWNMMMMSEGPVTTATGAITPERRMHNNKDLQQLPVATAMKTIPEGWNRFLFTGQKWKKHPSGGIDWYLYTNSSKPVNFTLAQWGSTFQNLPELEEFKKTNGRDYTEEQQILRMRSNEPFFAVLLPFEKGNDIYGKNITASPSKKMKIKTGEGEWIISREGYVMAGPGKELVALIGNKKLSNANGTIALNGGTMIVEANGTEVKVRVHGNSGTRKITVANKSLVASVRYEGVTVTASSSGTAITIPYKSTTNDLSPGQKGYTEYLFTVKK